MSQQRPPIDYKNMLQAMAVSMLLILAWQYFYLWPQEQKAKEAAAQQKTQQVQQPNVTAEAEAKVQDVSTVLAGTKRVKIQTPELSGSINLAGARLDDLHLEKYRETVDPKSPAISLLAPAGTEKAYFVEQAFSKGSGTVKLPDSNSVWTAPENAVLTQDQPLTLTWDGGSGLKIERTISISNSYLFSIKQTFTNTGTEPVSITPFARVQRDDSPVGTTSYMATFYEGPLGWAGGGKQEHYYTALKTASQSKKPGETGAISLESTGGWLGFTDKYWSAVVIPDGAAKVSTDFLYVPIPGRDGYQADYQLVEPISVPAGGSATYTDRVYAGAKVVSLINAIEDKEKITSFNWMIDWGWFSPITRFMFWLLSTINGFVGNFGVSILLVTVLVKGALFPLANRSYASMSKMKNLKPQMDAIKEQYPDDRAKQQQETMELYKREKVNPMAGCLPILIQIPIFFSLYKVIYTTIELRHAPFFGWIHDLSVADPTSIFNLFGLLPFSVPAVLVIGFWPLLMGITMWIQMRLNPAPPDPVQAQMFNWMPVIFTYSMAAFPAGLTIYWAWSNFLTILQQSYIMKKHGSDINILGNIRESLPFLKKKATA